MVKNLLEDNSALLGTGLYPIDSKKYLPVLEYIVNSRDLLETFGNRLRAVRTAANISQEALGHEIHVSHANISYMESPKGKRKKINPTYLMYFCMRFQVSLEYMLGFTDNPTEQIFLRDENGLSELVIDRYYNEPSKVLEEWQSSNILKLKSPMTFPPPQYAYYARLVVTKLWEHQFDLLFLLYMISKKPNYSCDVIAAALKETFLSKYTLCEIDDQLPAWKSNPSVLKSTSSVPKFKAPDAWNVYLCKFSISSEKDDLLAADIIYLTICNQLIALGYKSSVLLNEYVKIAISEDIEKEKIRFMLQCFVGG